MSLWGIEDLREWDGEIFGSSMGFHILGHLTDDEAVPYAWSILLEQDEIYAEDVALDPPKRTWVRKVPTEAGYLFAYTSAPGRGAYPVTLIEYARSWAYRCDLPGCERHYVKGGASAGIPVSQCIDPPADRQDERYVYMCRRHADSFNERLAAARRIALEELRAAS